MNVRALILSSLLIPCLALASLPATQAEGAPERVPDFNVPGTGAPPPPALINPAATPLQVAKAMEGTPGIVVGASWLASPPSGNYRAVSDTALTTFPSVGITYAMLSTGDATYASLPNSAGSTSANNGAAPIRGNSAYDAAILVVDLVPLSGRVDNCISLEYRFLSEEYPEWVGTGYNDAFIAEIVADTWTASNAAVAAPNNFAFSGTNELISINGVGATSQMSAAAALGTTYDGATPHYYAEARLPVPTIVNTVPHYYLYLSVFDQSDAIYDTTVFLDNLQIFFKPTCTDGPSTVVHP